MRCPRSARRHFNWRGSPRTEPKLLDFYHSILDRRVLKSLSYFDMPRKAVVRPIELVDEDQTALEAFMSHGKFRRPPLIWVPPRPALPRGGIRFEWHHFRSPEWFPKPKLTPAQVFAIQRDRAIRQDARRAKQRQRELRRFLCKNEPETQRTVTTRYGRTATALPSHLFFEFVEDDPAQSGT